ncbi:hypothetical protein HYX12_02405 [Candidatus Woesearchaeota archaeon]|nr:hypothetical protein [Candidatus Woesearchaeota archaeon]
MAGKVTKKVLENISPSETEKKEFQTVVSHFLRKLNSILPDAQAILGGSGAKLTWLSGNKEVDVFVQFNYHKFSERSEELSSILEKLLKSAFPKNKITKLHGSRDYFQVQIDSFIFEVLPILKITKAQQAKNITDISPLHAVWVGKHLKNKGQVLLAKQFCKANGLYGAESHIQGFSGYVLEILIAFYKDFEALLKASLKWKDKEVIDPEKYYPKGDASFYLNKSKQLSPIIVVDPVDKNRNAAAALSLEKLQLFQKLAKGYLTSPDRQYFIKQDFDLETLKSLGGNIAVIEVVPLAGKRDVIGSKLLKSFEFLRKSLAPFSIKKAGWEWDKFYFVLGKRELPKEEIRKGPPVGMTEFAQDFKKQNPEHFIQDGRIMAKVKVKYPKLGDFVKNLVQEKYFQEKIKKLKSVEII